MTPLEKVLFEKAHEDMTIISDVDGVHTLRDGGVKISGPLQGDYGPLLEITNGTRVVRCVPVDESLRDIEYSFGQFEGESVSAEFYEFHTPDGQAVQNLLRNSVPIIITSGRKAAPVYNRFNHSLFYEHGNETRRPHVYLGVKDKLEFFKSTLESFTNVIFISDGAQDAPLLEAVKNEHGIAVATADAEPEAVAAADVKTETIGGKGAFAELAKAYLQHIGAA